MKYDYLELGNKIRFYREIEGLSTRSLGEKVGVSHSEISRLENGLKANIGVYTLAKICKELKLNMQYVLENVGLCDELEDKLFYILVKGKDLNLFKINAKTEQEALLNSMDFILENDLIEFDENDKSVDIIIEENEEKLPKTIEEFNKKVNENKEDFISESRCEDCINYCPYCGECLIGE